MLGDGILITPTAQDPSARKDVALVGIRNRCAFQDASLPHVLSRQTHPCISAYPNKKFSQILVPYHGHVLLFPAIESQFCYFVFFLLAEQ